MSERVTALREELDKLFEIASGDEGLILTRATQADHKAVAKALQEIPLTDLIREIAIVSATLAGDVIQQQGKRPADYWRDTDTTKALLKRIVTELGNPEKDFLPAFQAVLKGRG